MTSPLLKRSDRPAGNTLSAAPMSKKKFIILIMTSKEGRVPGAWAFTDWQWRFPVTDETRAHGTVKQVWGEVVVVHALVKRLQDLL